MLELASKGTGKIEEVKRDFCALVLKLIALSAVLLGVILIAAKEDDTYDLGIVPYGMIIGCICILIVLALKDNRQQSLLCRIELHKIMQVGLEGNSPLLFSIGASDADLRRK